MSQRLDEALQEALEALSAGEPLEAVLSRYPALADDLRPLLAIASGIPPFNANPQPSRQAESKRKLLELAAQTPVRGHRSGYLIRGLAGALVVLALAFAMLLESGSSLPGEALYSVKRTVEGARLALAPDKASRQQIETDLQQERINEINALMQRGQEAPVELTGVWGSTGLGAWSVGGLPVVVSAGVSLPENLQPGMRVRISGRVENHELTITSISLIDDPPSLPSPSPAPTPTPQDDVEEGLTVSPTPDEDVIEQDTETPEPTESENSGSDGGSEGGGGEDGGSGGDESGGSGGDG